MLNVKIDDSVVVFENDDHSGILTVTKDEKGVYSILTAGHIPINHNGLLCIKGDVQTDINVNGSVDVYGSVNGAIRATGSIKCYGMVSDRCNIREHANRDGFKADIDVISGSMIFNGSIYSSDSKDTLITYDKVELERCSSIWLCKSLSIKTPDRVAFQVGGHISVLDDVKLNAISTHKDGIGIDCYSDIYADININKKGKVMAFGNEAGMVTCMYTAILGQGVMDITGGKTGLINKGRFYPYKDGTFTFIGNTEYGIINRGAYADFRVNDYTKLTATGPCALFNDVSTGSILNNNGGGDRSTGHFAMCKDTEVILNGSLKCNKSMYNSAQIVLNELKGGMDVINTPPTNEYAIDIMPGGVLRINDPDNCSEYKEKEREYFGGIGRAYCGDVLVFDGQPEWKRKGPITDVAVFENAYEAPAPGRITIIRNVDVDDTTTYKVEISGDVEIVMGEFADKPLDRIMTKKKYKKDPNTEYYLDSENHIVNLYREYANSDHSGEFALVQDCNTGKMCIAFSGMIHVDVVEEQTEETKEKIIEAFGSNVEFVPTVIHG